MRFPLRKKFVGCIAPPRVVKYGNRSSIAKCTIEIRVPIKQWDKKFKGRLYLFRVAEIEQDEVLLTAHPYPALRDEIKTHKLNRYPLVITNPIPEIDSLLKGIDSHETYLRAIDDSLIRFDVKSAQWQ